MYWCLVSRGIVSGICLVAAKYWYDTREERAARKNVTAESTSGDTKRLEASALAVAVDAVASAPSAVAADRALVLSLDGPDATTAKQVAGELHRATAVAFPGGVPHLESPVRRGTPTVKAPKRSKICRSTDDDRRVREALASGDLQAMDRLLDDICDPVLRNLLLNRLVTGYYRLRPDPRYRAALYRVADLQMEEAPSILEGIEEMGRPRPAGIAAFKSMAIALDEDGRQETAIAVCELALSLGLRDGTKTGFEGRIARLEKRRQCLAAARPGNRIH